MHAPPPSMNSTQPLHPTSAGLLLSNHSMTAPPPSGTTINSGAINPGSMNYGAINSGGINPGAVNLGAMNSGVQGRPIMKGRVLDYTFYLTCIAEINLSSL